MARRTLTGSLIAVALVATAPATIAAAQSSSQGVDRARAAGIKVDRSAAKAMERAPIGSCFNDPTQAKCPAAKRMVAQKPVQQPDGSVGFAITDEKGQPAAAAKNKARSSQTGFASAVPNCFVYAQFPVYAAGWASGQGSLNCSTRISYFELYVSLFRIIDGLHQHLDTAKATHGPGGGTIRRTASYDCNHTRNIQYRTVSEGYSILDGVWYGGTLSKWGYLIC